MISSQLKTLFERLNAGISRESGQADGPLVSVNRLTNRVGALYEKLRYLIDYKEEHTIRRGAIERILKRKLSIERTEVVGDALLKELVSGGYLPNNQIPESHGANLQTIIKKYLIFKQNGLDASLALSFSASEIEQFLYPQNIAEFVVDSFYDTVAPHVIYQNNDESDTNTITYIGCRRSLLSDDPATLLYAISKRYLPDLAKLTDDEAQIVAYAPKLLGTIKRAHMLAESSAGWRVAARLRNYAVYYAVIREIIDKYGRLAENIFEDNNKLEEQVRGILEEKYALQKKIISGSGNRAVLYILLTKIILALLLEWPYEKFFMGHLQLYALGTNVIFHPLLLLFMVKTVNQPDSSNTERVITGIHSVIHADHIENMYVRPPISGFLLFMVICMYSVMFVLSFGIILTGLYYAQFNPVSILLFFFFLTLVSYFGLRIRHNARRWTVVHESDKMVGLLWNLFTLPIIRAGRWLSKKFSSVNVFVLMLDFLVEAPFKVFLSILDAFMSFLKEQRVDPY